MDRHELPAVIYIDLDLPAADPDVPTLDPDLEESLYEMQEACERELLSDRYAHTRKPMGLFEYRHDSMRDYDY